MPVKRDKKTKRFVIEFQYKGERVHERLPKGTTRATAEELLIKRRNAILERINGIGKASVMTFERFLREYFGPHIEHAYSTDSFNKAVVVCKAALPYFKGKSIRSIKSADIERFMQSRSSLPTIHGKKRKPATIARELSIISKIFSLAVKNDLCDYNPCSRVDKPRFDNVQDKILRREDEARFLTALPTEWSRDVCRMVLCTGLRQNDLLSLTRFHVDRANRVIRLVQGKTQRRVEVALNSDAMEIIERRWQGKNKLLFPSPRTGNEKGRVRHSMTRACDKIGIPRITIRDLRRTFATRGLENGADAVTVADALGHSSLRMIPRYVRSLENKRKMVESLENPTTNPIAANDDNVRLLKRKG